MAGRTFAIGDIHGCHTALAALLAQLAPTSDDTLVVLGDVVDRGPGSRQVIDQLLEWQARCRLVFIQGNHEEMMLNALGEGDWSDGWLRYGGAATLVSYAGGLDQVPPRHVEFLKSGIDYWQTERELFVHANLEPGVPLERQQVEWLRWTHLTGREQPSATGQRVICGHTPQITGIPLQIPGWVGIDTYACGTGWLTALDVDTNEYFQARQSGEKRTGKLLN
ncbi:MAG: metallophosphoesterase [Planctomycetales bacterium]